MAAPVPGGCGNVGGGSGGAGSTAVCGNGVVEGIEQCDGTNLPKTTCAEASPEYGSGGRLQCVYCTYNFYECRRPVCGDGVVEAYEACEGTFPDGVDTNCASWGDQYLGGTMRCTGCARDDSGCITKICGNGKLDPDEACEGNEFVHGSDRCDQLNTTYGAGTLRCKADCIMDTSACLPVACGNGRVERGEACDGTNLGEARTCADLNAGHRSDAGVLRCGADCQYDQSGCEYPVCGDARIEGFEQCEGTNFGTFAGQDCSDFIYGISVFGIQTPFRPGPLTCSRSSCQFDLSQCRPQPGCYLTSNCGPLPTRPCLPTLHCVP